MPNTEAAAVLSMRGVQKDYRGLRPLRIRQLEVREGESVALLGLDRVTAELFVNLATGAVAPDKGDVCVFGESTAAMADGEAWLASLDRFGILSERAVLLDGLTVAQNLAMPFSLELDPIPGAVWRHVRSLAEEVGLDDDDLGRLVSEVAPLLRQRVRLGRALALGPQLLLNEHPNAPLQADDVALFAGDLARVIAARRLASITLTADRRFAAAVAPQVLTLEPATGHVSAAAGWRRWFGGG